MKAKIIFAVLFVIAGLAIIFFAVRAKNSQEPNGFGVTTTVVNASRSKQSIKFATSTTTRPRKKTNYPDKKIPILMYHYIRQVNCQEDSLGCSLSVAPEIFAEQMAWLKANGYQSITFSQIENWKMSEGSAFGGKNEKLTSKFVILTFDDGYQDFYTAALPILQANDFTAVVFMISGKIDKDGYLTAGQIKELSDVGVEFGSHTVNHPNLVNTSPEKIISEVYQSKNLISATTGKNVVSFAYPSGLFSEDALAVLEAQNISFAVTTQEAIANFSYNDPLLLPRLRVNGGLSQEGFEYLLKNGVRLRPTTTTIP